jgi:hypothetical protein
LRWARSLATVAVILPLVATTYITFAAADSNRVSFALWGATAAGGLIAIILSAVSFLSWKRQRRSVRSPWEQNRAFSKPPRQPGTFNKGAAEHHYDKPAMRVDSAEGWHTEFLWDDASEQQLINALKRQYRPGHLQDDSNGLVSGAASTTLKVIGLLRIPRARPDDSRT